MDGPADRRQPSAASSARSWTAGAACCLPTPAGLAAFGAATRRLLEVPAYAADLGDNARRWSGEELLRDRHLERSATLLDRPVRG